MDPNQLASMKPADQDPQCVFSHSQVDSMVEHVHVKIMILYHWALDRLEIKTIINKYIYIYVAFKTQDLCMP